jgi:hypothetical protein
LDALHSRVNLLQSGKLDKDELEPLAKEILGKYFSIKLHHFDTQEPIAYKNFLENMIYLGIIIDLHETKKAIKIFKTLLSWGKRKKLSDYEYIKNNNPVFVIDIKGSDGAWRACFYLHSDYVEIKIDKHYGGNASIPREKLKDKEADTTF